MEKCYLKDNVQKLKIRPYFSINLGDYFFPAFLWHPVFLFFLLQVAESYVLERENLEKRAYSDPDDPR